MMPAKWEPRNFINRNNHVITVPAKHRDDCLARLPSHLAVREAGGASAAMPNVGLEDRATQQAAGSLDLVLLAAFSYLLLLSANWVSL